MKSRNNSSVRYLRNKKNKKRCSSQNKKKYVVCGLSKRSTSLQSIIEPNTNKQWNSPNSEEIEEEQLSEICDILPTVEEANTLNIFENNQPVAVCCKQEIDNNQIVMSIVRGVYSYFPSTFIDDDAVQNTTQVNSLYEELRHLTPNVRLDRSILSMKNFGCNDDVITSVERERLLTDVLTVHENKLFLTPDTFSTFVNFFDRFVINNRVKIKFARITAVACYIIAVSHHESVDDTPNRNDLINYLQCPNGPQCLLEVEQIIRQKLIQQWPHYVETRGVSLDYLRLFHVVQYKNKPDVDMIRLLLRCICHESLMKFYPDVLAMSVIGVVRNDSISSDYLRSHINIKEIQQCMFEVTRVFNDMNQNLTTFSSNVGGRTIGWPCRSSYIMAKHCALTTIYENSEI